MKKTLAMLMALTMLFCLVLTGCGSEKALSTAASAV